MKLMNRSFEIVNIPVTTFLNFEKNQNWFKTAKKILMNNFKLELFHKKARSNLILLNGHF